MTTPEPVMPPRARRVASCPGSRGGIGCSLPRSILGLLVLALVASPVRAQSDAERTFREWAEERMQVLKNERNPRERADAAEYLGGFEYPEVVAALEAALRDPDARVRAAAAGALWKTGKPAHPARASLTMALEDAEPAVVIRAAGALQTLGVSEAELAPARRRVFDSPGVSNTDRFMAARGLIGHAPPLPLLDPILQFLERWAAPRPASADSITQRESFESAVGAVERLAKTNDRSLIAPLVEAVRTARYSQPALLKALALFRPKPEGFTTLLVGALDSRDPKARYAALALLGEQKDEKDVLAWAPRAADLLRDPDSSVRSEALWSLGRVGGLAADQVQAVVAILSDPDAAMRRRAVVTIGEMGDETQAVTAAAKRRVGAGARARLVALAESDSDAEVRTEAKKALAKLARDVAPAENAAPERAGATRGANASAEANAVAVLRERKVAMEPGAYFQALAGTDVTVVRAFLDAGMSSSAPVAGSGPPLVVALQVGDACAPAVRPTKADTKTLVRLLLDRGADANRADANGFTPLMAAAMKGCDRDVMKLLIGGGAKVATTNAMGLSAFEMGLHSGHDGLEELVAAGYRLPTEKAKAYEKAFADKPAALALVRKASRK